jgi:hypothetical protein
MLCTLIAMAGIPYGVPAMIVFRVMLVVIVVGIGPADVNATVVRVIGIVRV